VHPERSPGVLRPLICWMQPYRLEMGTVETPRGNPTSFGAATRLGHLNQRAAADKDTDCGQPASEEYFMVTKRSRRAW
jgi:hypothetical protein